MPDTNSKTETGDGAQVLYDEIPYRTCWLEIGDLAGDWDRVKVKLIFEREREHKVVTGSIDIHSMDMLEEQTVEKHIHYDMTTQTEQVLVSALAHDVQQRLLETFERSE